MQPFWLAGADAFELLKPAENQHADLEQEATEATEIFLLRSSIRRNLKVGERGKDKLLK